MEYRRFEFRVMVKDDVDEVAKLVAASFAGTEPITKLMKESVEDCYQMYGKPLAESCALHMSFVCVEKCADQKSEIVACILCNRLQVNELKTGDTFNIYEAVDVLYNESKRKFMKIHENDGSVDHIFFECLAVKSGYEKNGIASTLGESVLKNAERLGFKYALMMPTSTNAQYITEHKFKMKRIFSIRYEDIEFKGVRYLKDITDPPEFVAYECNLSEFKKLKSRI